MSKVKIQVWGRDFTLDIFFDEYKEYISCAQFETASLLADKAIEDGTEVIKDYIKTHITSDTPIECVDNIFKYVIPTSVYIPDTEDSEYIVMCDYKYDLEHGIALKYGKDGLISIDSQD